MTDDHMAKTIRFNNQRLNVGNAMDTSNGVFTAPISGIYQFSFSMTKDGWTTGELFVYLRLNSNKIGLSISSSGFYAGLASFQSILALKKGDRIDLFKSQGKLNSDTSNICHFTGLLLEEHFSGQI